MLSLVIGAMKSDDKVIWDNYFTDFITYKLKLAGTPEEDIVLQLLRIYFKDIHSLDLPMRMIHLHCHASVHHVSLAKLMTLLRPLRKIEEVRKSYCHYCSFS